MAIVFVGIDLAKNMFAVHGVNPAGKPERVRPSVPRAKLHEMIAALPPCTIGMEACSGAHHWARLFQALGHTVKLMRRSSSRRTAYLADSQGDQGRGIHRSRSGLLRRTLPAAGAAQLEPAGAAVQYDAGADRASCAGGLKNPLRVSHLRGVS
jgi:hypothetical protein